MSPFKIADLLEQDGIIRSAFIFKYYLKYKEQGDGFQAGIYELAPGITHDGDYQQAEQRGYGQGRDDPLYDPRGVHAAANSGQARC